jgi:alanine dehydrogenase
MSDGLTVPFALAAGLSGAAAPSSIVVTAGLAEVAAGSIAMGLGGWVCLFSYTDIVVNIRETSGPFHSSFYVGQVLQSTEFF